ncbi:MAG: outer membrane lipoprotein-sorting protein [Spirochaetota bacterium]
MKGTGFLNLEHTNGANDQWLYLPALGKIRRIAASGRGGSFTGSDFTYADIKRAWARLLSKVYEVDPFICPKCGSEMQVIAVIQESEEIKRILRHLVKIGRSPPGVDPASLN